MLTYLFDLDLRDICADNTITKTAELPTSTTYIIGSGSTTLSPAHQILIASSEGCLSSATLNFFDTGTSNYVTDNNGSTTMGTPNYVNSFSTTNGVLVINTSDVAKYAIQKNYKIRLILSLPESVSANKSV